MTVVARLPAWMQRAENRDEVLRAIARIQSGDGNRHLYMPGV